MTIAYIGGYNFIAIRGSINGMQERLEAFTRPGVDGISFQSLGDRAEVSYLQTVRDLPFLTSAANRLASYRALVGSVVTIIDGKGVAWYNMLILKVSEAESHAILTGSGGLETNPLALQTCNWEVQQL